MVRETISIWEKAGFAKDVLLAEKSIRDKIINLNKKWNYQKKLKTILKDTNLNKAQVEFLKTADELFDIGSHDFEKRIKADGARCSDAKDEDLRLGEYIFTYIVQVVE